METLSKRIQRLIETGTKKELKAEKMYQFMIGEGNENPLVNILRKAIWAAE